MTENIRLVTAGSLRPGHVIRPGHNLNVPTTYVVTRREPVNEAGLVSLTLSNVENVLSITTIEVPEDIETHRVVSES